MVKETLAVVKTLVKTYAKMSYILGNYHFLILGELQFFHLQNWDNNFCIAGFIEGINTIEYMKLAISAAEEACS